MIAELILSAHNWAGWGRGERRVVRPRGGESERRVVRPLAAAKQSVPLLPQRYARGANLSEEARWLLSGTLDRARQQLLVRASRHAFISRFHGLLERVRHGM